MAQSEEGKLSYAEQIEAISEELTEQEQKEEYMEIEFKRVYSESMGNEDGFEYFLILLVNKYGWTAVS